MNSVNEKRQKINRLFGFSIIELEDEQIQYAVYTTVKKGASRVRFWFVLILIVLSMVALGVPGAYEILDRLIPFL